MLKIADSTPALLRQLMAEAARLTDDDLPLAVEFVSHLAQAHRQPGTPARRPSVVAIRARAKEIAAQLGEVPRAELVAQFLQIADQIRAEASANGTALEINEETWQSE